MKRLLWKIYSAIAAERKSTLREEKQLIDSFPEPRNGYERSYYNYRINSCFRSRLYAVVSNVSGIIALPFFIVIFFINGSKVKPDVKHDAVLIHSANRTGMQYRIDDRVPEELYDEFKDFYTLECAVYPGMTRGILTKRAFGAWKRYTSAHPLCGFINFRALIHIAAIERILREYSPDAVINSRMELNNISSIVTDYCEENGCEHICFMHGESFANVKTAFAGFSRFYIWDEHYIDVFDWSRCRDGHYRIYTPRIFTQRPNNDNIIYDYMYVLSGDENSDKRNTMKDIAAALDKLAGSGCKVKVRPHPRWTDAEEAAKVFGGSIITEDAKEISSTRSVAETRRIIGTYSTMLSEALYAGREIVIDDVSDPDLIKELRDKKYIVLNKDHLLLSELI